MSSGRSRSKIKWGTMLLISLIALLFHSSLASALNSTELLKKIENYKISPFDKKAAQYILEHTSWFDISSMSEKEFLEALSYLSIARKTMPWGQKIPERIFLNYVAPLRISQERLVPWRRHLFEMVAPLVANSKSMREASLKINKWVAERVFYRPTDARDLDPLNLLKRGFGRCEEIDILYVAALRSVSIPARIVWIPAWRHVKGNHAWVEVYLDDRKWHYIDPSFLQDHFDRAWFSPFLKGVPGVLGFALDDTCEPYRVSSKDRICLLSPRYGKPVKVRAVVKNRRKFEKYAGKIRIYVTMPNGSIIRSVFFSLLEGRNYAEFSLIPGDYLFIATAGNGAIGMRSFHLPSGEHTNVVINLDKNFPQNREFVFRKEHFHSSISASPKLTEMRRKIAQKHKQIVGNLNRIIQKWQPDMPPQINQNLINSGYRLFDWMVFYELLQPSLRRPFLNAVNRLNSKDLVDIDHNEMLDIMDYLARFPNFNPRIENEPPIWKYRELRRYVGCDDKKDIFVLAKRVHELTSKIQIAKDSLLRTRHTPIEILHTMKSSDHKDIKILQSALFKSCGFPSVFVKYADKVFLSDNSNWFEFTNKVSNGTYLKEIRFSILKVSWLDDKQECYGSNDHGYFKKFVIFRWNNGRMTMVRKVNISWDKESCSYKFYLVPGHYSLAYEKEEKDNEITIGLLFFNLQDGQVKEVNLHAI